MFKHLIAPLAAASLLCTGCSQLKSFSGASDDDVVASASWNQSSETESSWSQEEGGNPTASNLETDGTPSSASFHHETGQGGAGSAEEASASPYPFSGSVAEDPATELFSRVEMLQTTTATLSADFKQMSKQISALAAGCNATAAHAQAADSFIESASGQMESFGETLASLDSLVTSVAAEVGATRAEIREVKADVRNVSSSTTAQLSPVIEQGSSSSSTWLKITLATMVIGFAALSYCCWKGFSGSRSNAAGC